MCVIMFKPMGVGPLPKQWLENAVENNSDGWGLLVRAGDGKIVVRRGFESKDFQELGSAWGEDYDVIAHARIATSGGTNLANLHPFPIFGTKAYLDDSTEFDEETAEAFLFHNGMMEHTIPMWRTDRNDTWHLARIWEAAYGTELKVKLQHRGWRRRQKNFLGSYNKFVLATKEGVTIINPNAGKWVDGVWHSNETARTKYQKVYKGYSGINTCVTGGRSDYSYPYTGLDDDYSELKSAADWDKYLSEGTWFQEGATWKYRKFTTLELEEKAIAEAKAEAAKLEALLPVEVKDEEVPAESADPVETIEDTSVVNNVDDALRVIATEIKRENKWGRWTTKMEDKLDKLDREDEVNTSPFGDEGGYDADDVGTVYEERVTHQGTWDNWRKNKQDEEVRGAIITDWIGARQEDIAESIYNYPAEDIAMTITWLMRKAGYSTRTRSDLALM